MVCYQGWVSTVTSASGFPVGYLPLPTGLARRKALEYIGSQRMDALAVSDPMFSRRPDA